MEHWEGIAGMRLLELLLLYAITEGSDLVSFLMATVMAIASSMAFVWHLLPEGNSGSSPREAKSESGLANPDIVLRVNFQVENASFLPFMNPYVTIYTYYPRSYR